MPQPPEIQIIFPQGHLGHTPNEDMLSLVMRMIGYSHSASPEDDWAEKYGTEHNCAIFLMHPFCWCEKGACLWCGGQCGCPESPMEYYLDGKQIRSWFKANKAIVSPLPFEIAKHGSPEYKRASKAFDASIRERDRRLKTFYPSREHSCQPVGLMENRDRGQDWRPRQQAPHFWFKPTGFKVWWYKYIGRDMETNRGLTPGELERIIKECVKGNATKVLKAIEGGSAERHRSFRQMVGAALG